MPPKRGSRSTATKKSTTQSEVKPPTTARGSRASKRGAPQPPSEDLEATQPATSHEEAVAIPNKRVSKKNNTTTQVTEAVENTTSTESVAGEAIPPIPATKRGRGRPPKNDVAEVEIKSTRLRARKPPAQKEETQAAPEQSDPKNANQDVATESLSTSVPKQSRTPAKRTRGTVADIEAVSPDGSKIRKVESGPVSHSKKLGDNQAPGPKRRPRQKKTFSPLPVNDPFIEQNTPVTAQTAINQSADIEIKENHAQPVTTVGEVLAPIKRPSRGRKTQHSNPAEIPAVEETETKPEPQADIAQSETVNQPELPKRRGRKPKATKNEEPNTQSAIAEASIEKEVDTQPNVEDTLQQKPGRGRRGARPPTSVPIRRSGRGKATEQPNPMPNVPEPQVSETVLHEPVSTQPTEIDIVTEQIEPDAQNNEDEETAPMKKPKGPAKRRGGKRAAKGRGKHQKKSELTNEPTEQELHNGQPVQEQIEADADDIMMEDPVLEQASVVDTDMNLAQEHEPVTSPQGNEASNHDADDEEVHLPSSVMHTPIPAPVIFSPGRTTQSTSEPTKAPTPIPSSPLGRFASPNFRSSFTDPQGDVIMDETTPSPSTKRRLRSSPSTPVTSSNKSPSFGIDSTPSRLKQEPILYTPKAAIRALDVSSSPILHPPQNLIKDDERSGKSPVKNPTPRGSLDPLTARGLFKTYENQLSTSDSPSRRSSAVSPVKRQSLSLTDYDEPLEETNSDNDTEVDETPEEDEPQEEVKLTDQAHEHSDTQSLPESELIDKRTNTGIELKEMETESTPATLSTDGNKQSEEARDVGEVQGVEELTEAEYDQESTVNDNSLFAIPSEDHEHGVQQEANVETDQIIENYGEKKEDSVTEAADCIEENTVNDDSLFAVSEKAEKQLIEEQLIGEQLIGEQLIGEQLIGEQGSECYEEDTVNNDSLFVVRNEENIHTDTVLSEKQISKSKEIHHESSAASLNAISSLNQPSLDALGALLPNEVREYFEETIENINANKGDSTLMLEADMNRIRDRPPVINDFDQRSGFKESDLSGMYPYPAFENSTSLDISAIIKEFKKTEEGAATEAQTEAADVDEHPVNEQEIAVTPAAGDVVMSTDEDYEEMLPAFMTSPEFSNLSTPRVNGSDPVSASPELEQVFSEEAPEVFSEDESHEKDVTWEDESLVEPQSIDEASSQIQEDTDSEKEFNDTQDGHDSQQGGDDLIENTDTQYGQDTEHNTANESQASVTENQEGSEQVVENKDMEKTEQKDVETALEISTKERTEEATNTVRKTIISEQVTTTQVTTSTPPRFSFPPPLGPRAIKRSLDESPAQRKPPTAEAYILNPDDLPDFDDDFSFMESPASERQTPMPLGKKLGSPLKPVSQLLSKIQDEDFEFDDEFSYIEDENNEGTEDASLDSPKKTNVDTPTRARRKSTSPIKKLTPTGKLLPGSLFNSMSKDSTSRRPSHLSPTKTGVEGQLEIPQENATMKASQLGDSPERGSPRTPLGEVRILARPTVINDEAFVDPSSTASKRRMSSPEAVSVKRGKHASPSLQEHSTPNENDTNEELSLIEADDFRPSRRRRSLRLSYLDSAASVTPESAAEPQGEVYLTPERGRYENLNPLFSSCPDSVQTKRRGRRTSIGQRRRSLELESNRHVYTKIQAAVRGYMYRNQLKSDKSEQKMAVEVFTSTWIGLKQRRIYLTQRNAAITLQRAVRNWLLQRASVNETARKEESNLVSDGKQTAGAVTSHSSTPEPEKKPPTQLSANSFTPRARRMATQSPVPAKYLYRNPNTYKRPTSVEPKETASEPKTATDDDQESKSLASKPLGSRIPRPGIRASTAQSSSSTSSGKRKAEDEITQHFAQKPKLTAAEAAAPQPRIRPSIRYASTLPKASSSTTPKAKAAPALVPGSNLLVTKVEKQPLEKMTQLQINQLTEKHTKENKKYNIDFERQVIRMERDRSSSPDAKTQHRLAREQRIKRYEIQRDTGIVLGPGDPLDYEPEYRTPSKKGVRWHEDLEMGWDSELEKSSPKASKRKATTDIRGIVKRKAPLDSFGNVAGPAPKAEHAPMKVRVTKLLFNGDKDDQN